MLAGSILHKLRSAHQSGQIGKRPLNFGVYYKNTLVELCHALEDAILTSASSAPLVITAFQRGKWYLQEADRYREIADKAEQIVIMASPDSGFADHPTSQRRNVALVHLDESDPVAQEWHLMILAPTYSAMVLCQELSEADYGPAGFPTQDLERKFYGLWTFESSLVQETMDLAIAHIGAYDSNLHNRIRQQWTDLTMKVATSDSQDDLGEIVARIVTYLQSNQQHAAAPFLDDNLTSNELQAFLRMAQIIDQTDLSNPMAAAEVAALAEAMGQLLDLPAWQLHRLRLAGLLHRLALQQDLLLAANTTEADLEMGPVCVLHSGTQALRTMNRLRAIATILHYQTESWDGTGGPAGLVGKQIPIEARILSLVVEFQSHLHHLSPSSSLDTPRTLMASEHLPQALAICQQQADKRFDPELVSTLTLLVNGLQQGLCLPISIPKIAAGLWMIDSHSQEELSFAPSTSGANR
jgi:DICT domain-containing protein